MTDKVATLEEAQVTRCTQQGRHCGSEEVAVGASEVLLSVPPSSPCWKFCFPRLVSLSQLFAAQVPLTKLMCVWLCRSDSGLFVCLQDFAGGCCRSSFSSSPPFQRSSGLCLRTTHCIKTKKCRDTNNDSGAWGGWGVGLVATADWCCCQWEYVCVDAGSQGRTTKKV